MQSGFVRNFSGDQSWVYAVAARVDDCLFQSRLRLRKMAVRSASQGLTNSDQVSPHPFAVENWLVIQVSIIARWQRDIIKVTNTNKRQNQSHLHPTHRKNESACTNITSSGNLTRYENVRLEIGQHSYDTTRTKVSQS